MVVFAVITLVIFIVICILSSYFYGKKIEASKRSFLSDSEYQEYKGEVAKFYSTKGLKRYEDIETTLGFLGYCVLGPDDKTELPENKVIRLSPSLEKSSRNYRMATFVISRFIPKEHIIVEDKNNLDEIIAKKSLIDTLVGLILVDEERLKRDMDFCNYAKMNTYQRSRFVSDWAKDNRIVIEPVEEIVYRISVERGYQ